MSERIQIFHQPSFFFCDVDDDDDGTETITGNILNQLILFSCVIIIYIHL